MTKEEIADQIVRDTAPLEYMAATIIEKPTVIPAEIGDPIEEGAWEPP